jgi:putative tryptophan/tyrosine transport system substrate-binding protein
MARHSVYETSKSRSARRCVIARASRRDFLWGSLALAGTSLLAGCARPPAPWQTRIGAPRVGVVNGATADFYVPLLAAFRRGLHEHGYEEGRTISIEERYLDGHAERAPRVVNELLQLGVAAIVTGNPATVQAAERATSTVPIIMVGVGTNPASTDRGVSRARSAGNSTGLSLATPALPGMRLRVLREIVPDAGHLGVLLDDNTGQVAVSTLERQVTESSQALGVDVRSVHVLTPSDLEPAFESMRQAGTGAVWVPATPLTASSIDQILDLALQYRLPALFSLSEIARGGGLMALSIDRADLYRRAAGYLDKVLKGARPADLPIGQPTALELVVNLQTAGVLGLTIPPSILLDATEIIQ